MKNLFLKLVVLVVACCVFMTNTSTVGAWWFNHHSNGSQQKVVRFYVEEDKCVKPTDADEVFEITGEGNEGVIGHMTLKYDTFNSQTDKYADVQVSYLMNDGYKVKRIHFNIDFEDNKSVYYKTYRWRKARKYVYTNFGKKRQFVTFKIKKDKSQGLTDANKIKSFSDQSLFYKTVGNNDEKEYSYVSDATTQYDSKVGSYSNRWKPAMVTPEQDYHPNWVSKGFVSEFGIEESDAKPVWKYRYSNINGPDIVGSDDALSVNGETVMFRRKISLSGVSQITSANLKINADNAYVVAFNNCPPRAVDQLGSGYVQNIENYTIDEIIAKGRKNDMVESFVWQNGSTTYGDETSLLENLNIALDKSSCFYLYFIVANEYFNEGDLPNLVEGTYVNNPAALIYKLDITGKIRCPKDERLYNLTYNKIK